MELARTLTAGQRQATLCTLTADGYPYGSVVSYAVNDTGAPLLLISELAEHTVNAHGDERVSMLVAAAAPRDGDPLGSARLTLLGRLRLVEDQAAPRGAYLERHPYRRLLRRLLGLQLLAARGGDQCRFVGGFGHMSWVTADAYGAATVDPLAEEAGAMFCHMNDDHGDGEHAVSVTALARLDDAGRLHGSIDRYCVTLRFDTPGGPRLARVTDREPLQRADQARATLIRLLQIARGKTPTRVALTAATASASRR